MTLILYIVLTLGVDTDVVTAPVVLLTLVDILT